MPCKQFAAKAKLILSLSMLSMFSLSHLGVAAAPSATSGPGAGGGGPGDDPSVDSLVGVLFARQEVDLTAEIMGRLEAVNVELGDRVSRGTVLAVLDARSIQRDLEMSRAELESAKAEQRKAALEYNLAKEKHERRAAFPDSWSEEEFAESRLQEELAAANLAVAQSRVSRAEAAVDQLVEMLASREIRAPFDGTIASRYCDPGALINPGNPVIRLISSQDIWVRFAAPESAAKDLDIGHPVRVSVQAADCRVTGSISHISPEIDPASQMLTVEAALSVPDSLRQSVRSGMTARVSLAGAGEL